MVEGLLMLTGVMIVLGANHAVNTIKTKKRGWKISTGDNFSQIYSEIDEFGNWRSIHFECKRYAKFVPRHAIIVDENWKDYPEWAAHRKEEILERIKSVLREPTYTMVKA